MLRYAPQIQEYFNKFLSGEDFEVDEDAAKIQCASGVMVGKVFYGDKSFVFKAQVDDLNEKDSQ